MREGREEGLDRGSKKGGNRRIIKGQRTRSIKGGDKNPEGSRKMSRFDRDRPLANGCARISPGLASLRIEFLIEQSPLRVVIQSHPLVRSISFSFPFSLFQRIWNNCLLYDVIGFGKRINIIRDSE